MTSNNSSSYSKAIMQTHRFREEKDFFPPKSSYNNVDLQRLPSLHRVVWKGRIQKVMKYLAQEKNTKKVNKVDYAGRTALHLAASCGKLAILRVLLSMCSSDIDWKDCHGDTPFFKAVQNCSLECMMELYLKGSKINVLNKNKVTPVEYLIKYVGDNSVDCFQFFLPLQNIEHKNQDGCNIFQLACYHNRIHLVGSLLDYNSDLLHTADNNGRTAFDYPVENSSIKELLHQASMQTTSYTSDQRNSNESITFFQDDVMSAKKTSENLNNFGKSFSIDKDVFMRMLEDYHKHKFELAKEEERAVLLRQKLSEHSQINCLTDVEGGKTRDKMMTGRKTSFKRRSESSSNNHGELQRAYEKLLMVQREKELELENRLNDLQGKELEINSVRSEIRRLEKEMLSDKQKVNRTRKQKEDIQQKVKDFEKNITKEKEKFRHQMNMFEQIKKEKILKVDNLNLMLKRKGDEDVVMKTEERNLKDKLRNGKFQLEYEKGEHLKVVLKSNKLRAKYETLQKL